MRTDSRPFFSIVIPVYNRSLLIKKAIECIIDQTFSNWELVIVDDASTDNTSEIVSEFCKKDPRVKLIKHATNKERGEARNTGIKNAVGTYICFLDSDDLFLENHLQVFYDHLSSTNFPKALLFTNSYLENEQGERHKKIVPDFPEAEKFAYILRYTFNPTRVCVHKDIVKEIKFDISIPGLEDIDLWLRIALSHPIIHIKEYTNVYLVHEGSYTSAAPQRYQKELKNFKYIFAKPELQHVLPRAGTMRLLSMCNFHLALEYERNKKFLKMYSSIILSYFQYPKGYNGKTNKILATLFLYHIPLLGRIFKNSVRAIKSK